MMNPNVTPDTDLAEILSDHQIGLLRALRNGGYIEVTRNAAGEIESIELIPDLVILNKSRYVRATTFDYLSRIHLLESIDSGKTWLLSQVAKLCLAKLDGASEPVAEAAAPMVETEDEAPQPVQVSLSQAQIKVLRQLDKGAHILTIWKDGTLTRCEVHLPDGRMERIAVSLFQSLHRKGLLDGGVDVFTLHQQNRARVARYL